ncbi:Metallo-dependent phosphatase [Fomitiporia mediterranea MF3/22]|uniref:Metallo-dependent phosphatase n=1 Tax=Fomitiporia mediterranea (strain MF3/22) TaxID=694068 RepID=UPI00044077DD|nr:Metallo-dependent phosphatase [Fomitiporia mediterranea MF3/22]EJD07132.1 Metallo-dependent phosphatase [Fomitiporia mediterranea MF3/22]
MLATRTSPRQLLAFFVLGFFVTFVLFLGISNEAADYARRLEASLRTSGSSSKEKPDLDQYVFKRTLSDKELDFDDADRRIIFIGDIHGMKESLDKLLNKAHYNIQTDHIIHAGDIVAKGPHDGSLDVLTYMTKHNITGVRGNHDQMVIGWRAWIEEVLSHPGGAKWLKDLERKSKRERKAYIKALRKAVERGKEEQWKRIPEDWEFMSDHYTIARSMSPDQATYLRSLPLVLHIPHLHAFVLHAGLLPLDPRRSPTSDRQPLAHVPEDNSDSENDEEQRLRKKQEEAVLSDIPQNRDPWNILNIRSILKDNTITKDSKTGHAWAPLWNTIVKRCGGFDLSLDVEDGDEDENESDDDFAFLNAFKKEKPLPCHPSTVIYGHAASRGLDIKRWSKGLDTGCVYGRRLTALVLTPPNAWVDEIDDPDDETEDDDQDSSLSRKKKMRFGDKDGKTANARVVSVSCPDL